MQRRGQLCPLSLPQSHPGSLNQTQILSFAVNEKEDLFAVLSTENKSFHLCNFIVSSLQTHAGSLSYNESHFNPIKKSSDGFQLQDTDLDVLNLFSVRYSTFNSMQHTTFTSLKKKIVFLVLPKHTCTFTFLGENVSLDLVPICVLLPATKMLKEPK